MFIVQYHIYAMTYVTMDHKTSHMGSFFEIDIYT